MNSTLLESYRPPRSVGALLGHRAASASTSVPQSCCGCDPPVALAVPAKVAGFRRTKETTYVPSPAVGRAGRVAPATVASPLDGLGRHLDARIGTGSLGRVVAQSVTASRQTRIASEVAFPPHFGVIPREARSRSGGASAPEFHLPSQCNLLISANAHNAQIIGSGPGRTARPLCSGMQ